MLTKQLKFSTQKLNFTQKFFITLIKLKIGLLPESKLFNFWLINFSNCLSTPREYSSMNFESIFFLK